MTASNFQASLNFIWGPGRDGSRQDSAPGEPFLTVKGITQMTWDNAVRGGIVTGSLSDSTDAQLAAIYMAFFWNGLNCSGMPTGLDLVLFSNGCLMGIGHEARALQTLVKATVDGAVGPQTTRKAVAFGAKSGIDGMIAADLAYLKQVRTWPTFGKGWTQRMTDTKAAAYALAKLT